MATFVLKIRRGLDPDAEEGAAQHIFGPTLTVAEGTALGGEYATYEGHFDANVQQVLDWVDGDAGVPGLYGLGASYDPPLMLGIRADRIAASNPTLAATFRAKADYGVVAYRDGYLKTDGAGAPVGSWANAVANPSEPWHQPFSLLVHYLRTGSSDSLSALGLLGDRAAGYVTLGYIGDINNDDMSTRLQAHWFSELICAKLANAPSVGIPSQGFPGGNNWDTVLATALTAILGTQDAGGGFLYPRASPAAPYYPAYSSPFQQGLLCEAFIVYYRNIAADARIVTSMKALVDYWIARVWDDYSEHSNAVPSLLYLEYDLPNLSGGIPRRFVYQADTNGFHLPVLGWLYNLTGNTQYLALAEQLLVSMNASAFLGAIKQFTESFHGTYRLAAWKSATPLATPSLPVYSVAPVITGTLGSGNTLTMGAGTVSGSPSSRTYQWRRITPGTFTTEYWSGSSTADVGSNQSTYALTGADVGKQIYGLQKATNGSGTSVWSRTATTAVVT